VRGVTRAPPCRPGHLDLRGQNLTAVPEWVWSLRGLETLNLSENNITSVPDEIARFSRLRMLDLGHNDLSELPDGLGELVNLSDYLYLSDNRLTKAIVARRIAEAHGGAIEVTSRLRRGTHFRLVLPAQPG